MHTPTSSTATRRRLAWLLWLALLLPIAQAAATWHAMSHVRLDAADVHGKQALKQTHCDLCLTVAAVTGGALTAKTATLPHPAVRHAAPQHASTSIWIAAPAQAYRSRAPPIASH